MERVLSERALLVDDHDLLAQAVTRALRVESVAVDRIPTGSTAKILAAADTADYDLVVVNADHAGESDDIYEVIAGLHARDLAVVVLTDSADVAQSALDRGASRVVRPDQGAAALRDALGMPAQGA